MLDYPIILTIAELRSEKVVFERTCSCHRFRRILDRSFGIVVQSVGQLNGPPADHCVRRYCVCGVANV